MATALPSLHPDRNCTSVSPPRILYAIPLNRAITFRNQHKQWKVSDKAALLERHNEVLKFPFLKCVKGLDKVHYRCR